MISTATWPASWNCRSFRSTTAWPKREVRATGIHAELHPERPVRREPLLRAALRNEVDAAARERRQHVGGHGAAMLPAHLPDPAQDAGVHSPAMTRRHFPLAAFTAACAVFSAACGVHLEDVPRRAARADVLRVCGRRQRDHAAPRGRGSRGPADVADPHWIRDAAVAIEDRRFYQHHGIDGRAILRASYVNLRDGSIEEGGSTITQQLVKNLYTGGDRTISRKLSEASLAWQLEDRLSKEEILTRYLNTVYFGQGAYGVQAAARTFFGVDASEAQPRAVRAARRV